MLLLLYIVVICDIIEVTGGFIYETMLQQEFL